MGLFLFFARRNKENNLQCPFIISVHIVQFLRTFRSAETLPVELKTVNNLFLRNFRSTCYCLRMTVEIVSIKYSTANVMIHVNRTAVAVM